MIEGYKPSAEEEAAWQAERDSFIERTFGSITVGCSGDGQPMMQFRNRSDPEGSTDRAGVGGDPS